MLIAEGPDINLLGPSNTELWQSACSSSHRKIIITKKLRLVFVRMVLMENDIGIEIEL